MLEEIGRGHGFYLLFVVIVGPQVFIVADFVAKTAAIVNGGGVKNIGFLVVF